jgi:release factor glutamine methyltransferase
MKVLGEILKLSTEYLQEKQITRAKRSAEELIAHLLGIKRLDVYMQFDRPLEEKELILLRKLLARRGKGEPLDYILGQTTFYTCLLEISPAVLIPRPETEILLDKACKELKEISLEGKVAWDICTGSGCLGIGLKKTFSKLCVTLSDLSLEALEVAKKNISLNGLAIEVVQGDLLTPFAGKKADIVFCNPPYISETEYAGLDREVRDFEPRGALVGGKSGLEFYESLSRDLPGFLNPKAKVFFEIGAGQKEDVLNLFSAPCWKTIKVEKDWAGHDRFFFLEIE